MKPQSRKNISVFLMALLLPLLTSSLVTSQKKEKEQEIQEEAIAINIEVPVRVFTKGKFVEELNLEDFEVYEDGVLQKIEALYLVKKTVIEREETELDKKLVRRIYLPEVSRTFVLIFEMMDYFPKIEETLEYFFENVFLPNDSLYVVTPLKTYSLKKELLEKAPKEIIVSQLKEKLMKDIKSAARELKSMFRDLEDLAAQMNEDQFDDSIRLATEMILRRIRDYRDFNEKRLMAFKNQLKDIEGQKYVFLFYQNMVIPIPYRVTVPDDIIRPPISFNVDRVTKAFSDSLISIHFIFLTKTEQYHLDGYRINPAANRPDPRLRMLNLIDQSGEIFGAFNEIAEATGGTTDSSANMASSFQRAATASENYYLLYYTPKNYKANGKFKKVEVKVKGNKYRVTHRAGYIAD